MKTINGCCRISWDDTSPEYRIAAAHVKPPRCAALIRRTPGHRSSKTLDQGEDSVGGFCSTASHAEELGMKFRRCGSPSSLNVRYRKGFQWAVPHMGLSVLL